MIESFIIAYSFQMLIIGAILFIAQYVLPIGEYKIIGQFAGVMLISLGLFFKGKEQERIEWEAKMNEAKLEIASLQALSAEVNTVVLTEFYPKIRYVDRVQQQVVKEFITVKADNACIVNNGFVRLHDSIVSQVLIKPEPVDEEPSDVKLSDISAVVKDNYSACHRTAIQLKTLQDWVIKQEQVWNEKK